MAEGRLSALMGRDPAQHAAALMPGILIALAGGLVVGLGGHGVAFGLWTCVALVLALGWGRIIGGNATAAPEAHVLIGVAAMAHAVALPVLLAGLPILAPAALLPLGLLGLLRPRGRVEPNPESGLCFALCLASAAGFALIWSLETSGRMAAFSAGGPLRVWSDIFIHAGTIADFGDPRSVGRGSSALVDVPAMLYHAVSHGLAGLALRLVQGGTLETIFGFWLPFGIFLTTLGILALGRALAGLAGAALALGGLALLPDAAAYGLRQGLLSFHWMLETSPGSLYALPTAMTSLALLVEWTRGGRLGALIVSTLMLAAVFMLRAHIFVWMVVPWAVTLWLCLPWPGARLRAALLMLGVVAAVPSLLWLGRAEIGSVGLTSFAVRYLEYLHMQQEPTGYAGLYAWLTVTFGRLGAAPFGILLALIGMGGVWLLTFLGGAAILARRHMLEAADAFPVALLAWACAAMVLAPSPFHGDFTEFRQRAFVLVFVVLLVWSARFAVTLAPRFAKPLPLGLFACLALGATLYWMPTAKHPRMAWAAGFNPVQPRHGLVETARWIGAEARPGESFLVAGLRPEETIFDDATIVLGLSGVPAWLSRPRIMELSGGPRSAVAAQRLARAAALQAEPDAAVAFAGLRAAGIGFYVARTDMPPAWDPAGRLADFRAGDMLGWRIPR